MEKQGMVKRKRFFRAGLLAGKALILFFIFLSLPSLKVHSEEGENLIPFEMEVETSPLIPFTGNFWSVFILVKHPNPLEVNIKPPPFPPSLTFERARSESRTINGERWTRTEFLFTANSPGPVILEPFLVTVRGMEASTQRIEARVRDESPAERRYEPRFRWVSPVPIVPLGEEAELSLELSNWDPQKNAPRGFLSGRAPVNAITDEGSPVETGEGIFRYSVTFIPLAKGDAEISAFSFNAGGYEITVPPIIVPVTGGKPETALPMDDNFPLSEIEEKDTAAQIARPLSPKDAGTVLPLLRGEYEKVTGKVLELWNNNRRAEALAEIRRHERDSFSGPLLRPLRREMEEIMGLGFTTGEKWQPLKLSLLTWGFLGMLLISLILFLFVFKPVRRLFKKSSAVKSVTSTRKNGFKSIIIPALFTGLIVILLAEGFGNFFTGRVGSVKNRAVLMETNAYRIPDAKGAVSASFEEGRPVTVSDFHLDWCYAESGDGRFGWVKREFVIIY